MNRESMRTGNFSKTKIRCLPIALSVMLLFSLFTGFLAVPWFHLAMPGAV